MVIRLRDGFYGYLIRTPDGGKPRESDGGYPGEEEAMQAADKVLEVNR